MTGESNTIESLMLQRAELIGKLSQATAEHMRILRVSSGIDVLLMKQPQSPEDIKSKSETEARITNSQSHVDMLEASLAVIDNNIETTLNSEA
ncbi:hypothetical protein [Granulosicoccus antarcticus]|uniref:Uncharacterized protein n=1 Tax=Granulosicoccus antarcticus IMCC3135 TaxID=1192854 RepID=A0A2Z2NYM8_9GAMM|nr:hypothetical protein [Granulosicoccus antarcticus]ASJ74858.1 hypothetical protein IMCC3135_23945 [Granulosicoccus antarcticus IMCC3135]